MKAAQITGYGGQDVLQVNNDVPKPVPSKGQVLVKVHSAAVNPFDAKVREGAYKEHIQLNLPATLGGDAAGTIEAIGEDVSGFSVGQAVYGEANAAGGQGSLAEFTLVASNQVAPKPEKLDFNQAAALPLAATSAYQAIVDHIQLKAGQKILIHGAGGGIGSMAVQMAKHIGADITATASTKDLDYVKQIGAGTVIDYTKEDFSTLDKDYDAVFDTVGGETTEKSYTVLKPGGVLVSMASQENPELVQQYNITFISQQTKSTTEHLAGVTKLVDSGELQVNIDKVFTLDEAAKALEYLKTGHPRGKVVVQVI
jgi:alcohol dehydrogenase